MLGSLRPVEWKYLQAEIPVILKLQEKINQVFISSHVIVLQKTKVGASRNISTLWQYDIGLIKAELMSKYVYIYHGLPGMPLRLSSFPIMQIKQIESMEGLKKPVKEV